MRSLTKRGQPQLHSRNPVVKVSYFSQKLGIKFHLAAKQCYWLQDGQSAIMKPNRLLDLEVYFQQNIKHPVKFAFQVVQQTAL